MTCARDDTLLLNWGSDLVREFNWPNGAAGNADLTGYSVSVINVHPDLVGRVAVSLITPATGRIRITLTWADTIPRGRVAYFQIRITSGAGLRDATTPIWLEVQ